MGQSIICQDLTKVYTVVSPLLPGRRRAGPSRSGSGVRGSGASARELVPAVDGLNLSVGDGEFFGLLGPNGAGKSTTIGMLTTRVVPTSGTAVVAGVDVVAQPALARTRLSAVTQTNTLDRSLDVFDNLYFHGRYFGLTRVESRRRAHTLIDRFRLEEKAHARVESLSGGLAQRVQIARALLHEPQVLFLDEPTAGLDPQARLALWDTLRDLHGSGQTILLTTHYMEEADELCQRVAIIDHGHLLALDSPQRLKQQVGAQRIVNLTLARPDGGAVRSAIEALAGIAAVEGDGRSLHVFAATAAGIVGRVVTAVSNADAELTDLSVIEPSLEAVYLKLTGREYRE